MLKNNKIKIVCLLIIGIVFFAYVWTNYFHERWISDEAKCKFV